MTAPKLTRRQSEILELIAQGRTQADVGEALGITRLAVRGRMCGVKAAFGVTTTREAVEAARRLGLVSAANGHAHQLDWGERVARRRAQFAEFVMWGMGDRRWSKATARVYTLHLERAEMWLAEHGRGELRDATRRDLREFLASTLDSAASRSQSVKALRAYFRWLQHIEERDDDPAAWLPTIPDRAGVPKPLSPGEVADVLAAARAEGLRWYTAVCALLYAGLRASEACALAWRDLEGDGAWVRVVGKGARTRVLPVHPQLADALAAWRRECPPGPWVFPALRDPSGPMCYDTLHCAVRRIGERAGVDVHPHRCRHTFGTTLMNATGDLALTQDAMGHATPETTRVYARVHPQRMAAAVQTLDLTGGGRR